MSGNPMDDAEVRSRAVTESSNAMAEWRETCRSRWPFVTVSFECGVGWKDILERLFDVMAEQSRLSGSPVVVRQVKEKFGELRVYWTGEGLKEDARKAVRDAVEVATQESSAVCELCGKPGRQAVSKPGWWATRCPDHEQSGVRPVKPSTRIRIVGKRGASIIVNIPGEPEGEP